ncbi:MAG TPA: pitrilysin family protein [Candidatus Dormibacteraeota bacterium]|nr:pitrilysin family protein [Candidatus Dormibacteraeota bacterium]
MGLETDLAKLVEEQPAGPGIKCLLYKNANNPTVAVHGSILAGTSSEPSGKSGLAELTTRLLIRGTRKLGAGKIADQLESVGAAVSFRNSQDSIIFQARMTSPWTKRVLGVVEDCLTRPALSPRDIEREREGLLTDIRLRDDDTTRRGMRELQRLVYPPGHPYRKDRFGTAETVKDIDRSDIKDYFENVISKAPTLIAFAGQFKKDGVVSWAGRTFGTRDEKRNNSKKSGEASLASKNVKREIVMPHKTQADILIGAVACSRTEPDYEPLNLLNVILGELGFMGRLGQRVRDKEGLAYSCTSFLNAGIAGGSWTALAGVNPRNVAKALELMKEEIERVRQELVEEQELADAKQNQLGSALMELESTEGIARTSHNLAHFNLGLDYFVKRRQLFSKITREDLMSMGKKYLDGSRLSTVIVGPRLKG